MSFSLPTSMKSASRIVLAALLFGATELHAQQPTTVQAGATLTLSLDDALRLVQTASQTIEVARAGVVRATGGKYQARSQYLPQLGATAGYTKTLKSQFSGFAGGASSAPDTTTTTDTTRGGGAGGFDLSKTSFGATNQYAFGLNFSQNVFTGGRITAQNRAADAQLRSANIEVDAQRAQAWLDVTQAYYDAVLADQLVAIADSSLAETEALLSQAKVAKQVGNASEYELLRAQVTRDNQMPVLIQARANRQTAYLRLKQLLNLPLDNNLALTTGIEGSSQPSLPTSIANNTVDTSSSNRAPVRELDEAIKVQEAQVKIAKAERIPSFAITSAYQRLYFPSNPILSNLSNGVNNWTVGISTAFPIFDGGRIKGDRLVAESGLQQTRAQREQTRQFAALDARVALTALQEAEATWASSQGTADQAQKAYAIDQVRYREGISTQTDLSQSRLLLEQAKANRAQAARNLAVARVKLALLKDLPLSGTANAASSGSSQSQSQQQQQSQAQQSQQQQQQRSNSTGTPGSSQP